ncbi:PREDICTED: formin-binding protein 4-like isoform X2 [Wasmannia auropunctata]|uniref:formin-binding protein 4-like isoform X2 n=1 Tax=Wasmannia auropunctata TaxID=64793 RepID=UPI0005EDD6F0|nr:PREDICTED: formin-binding protein 4-like isoform X2 [Wasmannia auropunctata]
MKRRQRRPVLTLNKQGSHHGEHTQGRCKPINNVQPTQSEANNPLANMLCQYNSDSDTEDPKKDTQKLDDQVNDFLKEIQLIAPEQPVPNIANDSDSATKAVLRSAHHTSQQTLWHEIYDDSTGYPYYWHIETNEVTWEMPEELRLLQKQSEAGSGAKHPIQGPHWVDFSSIAYRQSQANIPEGMIPQEVVARNRNRFLHNNEPTKKYNLESKPEMKNESPTKDDDSDDGRIEMITSFGSDGSDSEDENNSSDENKTSTSLSEPGKSNSVPYVKSGEIGPAFCPTGIQSPTKNLFPSYKSDSTDVSNSTNHPEQLDEHKITESDKSKSSVVQGEKEFLMGNKNKKDINSHSTVPKLDLNVSLVPGYGDDSDGEEEVRPKQEIKPLFPIVQNEEYVNVTNSLKNTHDALAKNSDNVQASDQCSDHSNEDTQEAKNDQEKTEEKESKVDEDKSKANIFLEDMQVCGKAFQRKKRIAFDVTSTKAKQSNNTYHENTIREDNGSDLTSSETISRNTEDSDAVVHNQLCTESQKECDEAHKEAEQCVSIKTEEKLSLKDESCDSEVSVEHKTVSNVVEEKVSEEMNDLSQIITEKLKFLSEGRESVSAVQTMQIQLQTLSTAWTTGSLEDSYFQKWLTNTNHELERLEQDAAPAGWLCQWDRSHKRYYYHNTSTGTLQWTYPDTGIAGGTEEMELCTTPPPESEELSVTESPGTKKMKEKQAEEMDDNKADDENVADRRSATLEAPPPPQISNPSPPPPPRIFAEDLKKDKKKREKPDDKFLDAKRRRLGKERIMALDTQMVNPALESLSYAHPQVAASSQSSIPPNHVNMEPLPPGVDLPDTSYEAATLKGIIYNAASQPSNAIYAPSIADPTIPILSHQAGLLQEPFVHYPTFHQHLHNTIAVANKHPGQSAIQFMVGYAPIYTNNKIIAKPPVKASKESLGSALDSFYNDIARIEQTETERTGQHQDVAATVTEQVSIPTEEAKPEMEPETVSSDTMMKERKKKKARISNSKKHKEMSSMVAKWQRVQKNLEDTV